MNVYFCVWLQELLDTTSVQLQLLMMRYNTKLFGTCMVQQIEAEAELNSTQLNSTLRGRIIWQVCMLAASKGAVGLDALAMMAVIA